MYTIYVDGELLYAPTLVHEGYAVLNPKLTVELNKAGSLTFLLPPNNVMYDRIQKLKSVVTVLQDNEEIFRGRVLHDTRDFYNRKDVYCEGELSFLLDSIQRPYNLTGSFSDMFTQLINTHNEQVDEFKRFTVGIIEDPTVDEGGESTGDETSQNVYENTNYPKTLDELTSKILDVYGGYLRPRFENGIRYLDYVKHYGELIDQTIEFGINLLDISEYISADEIFTVLIPLGQSENSDDKMTIESVTDLTSLPDGIIKDGDHLEDEAAIALFGRIWKTQDWENVPDEKTLMNLGSSFLQSNIEMAVSLTVKAVDLHFLNVNTGRIKIGSYIRVVSPPHKLDREFLCSKISIDLVSPDKTEFTLGVNYTTLTENQANGNKVIQNTVTTVQKAASNSNQAVTKVNTMVNQLDSDFVKTTTFNETMTSASIFKILTNNGEVQGMIRDEKTGDIYINASYIKSGTLTLGGKNPSMQVVNDEGVVCVRVDEDGIHILDGEVNATSGTLDNMTIYDGITISSKGNEDARDIPLVSIETVESGSYGTYYRIAFGESTNRTTPLVFYGSSIEFSAPSGLTFTSDNIIFNGSVEVSDIYVNKKWTPLTLINNFENKNFEASQLEYRAIGKHVYIRGSIKFPDDAAFSGSTMQVATLPSLIRPKHNHYEIKACGGARLARIFASSNGAFSLEWIRLLSDGTPDTSIKGTWVSMNMDYWID